MELRVHVPSALIGACALGLVLLATGAQHVLTDQSPKTLKWPVEVAQTLRIDGIPAARDMVMVEKGVPYTVPSGKLFALIAMGTTDAQSTSAVTDLVVNGQQEARVQKQAGGPSVMPYPPGLVLTAGSILEVEGTGTSRAYGYLADA